jgi:hypothetical protein
MLQLAGLTSTRTSDCLLESTASGAARFWAPLCRAQEGLARRHDSPADVGHAQCPAVAGRRDCRLTWGDFLQPVRPEPTGRDPSRTPGQLQPPGFWAVVGSNRRR